MTTTTRVRKNCKHNDHGGIQRYSSPLVKRHHEVSHFHDPMAKQSHKVRSDKRLAGGDGDIWVEKLCQSTKTGRFATYFESTNTGKKHKNEPPTGASTVVFLKDNFVQSLQRANKHHL